MIVAENTETGKKWVIKDGGNELGYVERFATGFMLTVNGDPPLSPPLRIKRFRMIDALRQAFGEGVEIRIEHEPQE
jgi:hypothetical protein